MNFLERTLGLFSPSWALQRARARAALRVMHSVELGYDAASTGRRAGKWVAANSSANTEITGALSRVRARSRDMVRNNAYARSAISKLVARAIGTGIMARPPRVVQPVWKEFVERADFEGQHDLYGLESLVGRTVFESGECLVRRIRTKDARMPLQIQVLEPDYLDDTKMGPLENGNFAIAGVEVDALGRRAAYWLYPQHPGELVQLPKSFTSKRVPASEILHVYEKERPGQLRGMPRLSTTLMRLRDVDEYQDAVMVRKKIEACFAAFWKSAAGTTAPLAETANVSQDEKGRRIETLSPGIILYGKPGDEMTFGGVGAIARDEYTVDQLHAIAAGAGVTYEQLTGDFSQVTYLSARAAQLELRELVEMFRWIHFIPMFCRGVWGWFLDAGYTAGRLRTDVYPVQWTPPAWGWIDPMKDVQAAKEEIKGGLSSWSERVRQLGQDPDDVLAEIVEERKKFKDAGVAVDTMSASPSSSDPKPDAEDDKAGVRPPKQKKDSS